jgi:hypothetical protein
MFYHLADDIYPSWATFVTIIPTRKTKKEAKSAKAQEACRKEIKRVLVFGKLGLQLFVVQLVFETKEPSTTS